MKNYKRYPPVQKRFYSKIVPDAIEHFGHVTGVKVELPPPEQREKIKREEETLPPQRDFTHTDAVLESYMWRQRHTAHLGGGLLPGGSGPVVVANNIA